MRFWLQNFISRSFHICLRYSFLIFFLSSLLVWWYLLPKFPNTCNFPFLQTILFFIILLFWEFFTMPLVDGFFYFQSMVQWNSKIQKMTNSFLFVNWHKVWPSGWNWGDLFVSQSPRKFYASHFLGQILIYGYTICHHGQILISCTILSEFLFPPIHAYACTPFVPVCCIHLLYDELFHFCHYIIYTVAHVLT